ncbi:hypothetical protein ACOQFV_24420 [Nocardiopsis changdeensis]|uniref:Uncharacterized protein n=1 Tax=Nocardiopsis changdeensis TaxID=2831969 RepID=A0A975KSD9_9ACTN|nr:MULTISPECIES: hypothetical protein [Nocardiopsis]QUX26464.1 hypothetical protein KGD84_32720 [Nocardiopsis changdeensis]QYX40736.1 hypothetical protein K1J57_32570 [Nocardiopsis sp. MT53]
MTAQTTTTLRAEFGRTTWAEAGRHGVRVHLAGWLGKRTLCGRRVAQSHYPTMEHRPQGEDCKACLRVWTAAAPGATFEPSGPTRGQLRAAKATMRRAADRLEQTPPERVDEASGLPVSPLVFTRWRQDIQNLRREADRLTLADL